MGIVVHVVDSSIHSDSKRFEAHSTRAAGDVVISIGAACNGLVQAIADIRNATSIGSIDALIFYGHGAPGLQGVSMGKDGTGARELSALTVAALSDPAALAQLQGLSRHFSAKGVVVLRGCNTAEGQKGADLLAGLSKRLGVPVKGSDWYQIVGRSDLAGNILIASPSGQITTDSHTGLKNLGGLPPGESLLLLGAEMWDRMLQGLTSR